MRSKTDHDKIRAKRAAVERAAGRTEDMRDLTDVLRYSTQKKEPVKKGAPIGQRWD